MFKLPTCHSNQSENKREPQMVPFQQQTLSYDGGVHVSSRSIMSVCYHLKALKLCTAVLPLSIKAPHICC